MSDQTQKASTPALEQLIVMDWIVYRDNLNEVKNLSCFEEVLEKYPPLEHGIGASLIIAERMRQVDSEGYTAQHDDAHPMEMLQAAMCYCYAALTVELFKNELRESAFPAVALDPESPPAVWPIEWPWQKEAWKPTEDALSNLVKAGALIAAEIDRISRMGRA